MRLLPALLSCLLLAPALPASGQQPRPGNSENQFDANVTLFTTLAAINAAGYDAGVHAPIYQRYRIREEVRAELAKKNLPSLVDLKEFYRKHKKPSDTADLSQYISFALLAGPPPSFNLPATDLPEDVTAMQELSGILARFYAEANLGDLWNRSQPAYTAAIGEYQPAVLNAVLEANAYTRSLNTGYLGRRFQIYLDVMGAPDQIQIRSYKDDYFVVITPTVADVTAEIRDAYLAYLLDPLSFKYAKAIAEKKKLQVFAEEAPALDIVYKDDFSLLVTKSLIKAIDSRLLRNEQKRQLAVEQAMREGYVLTAAFADQLVAYEKQDAAMRIYYPDMIAAIDVGREQKRLRKIDFVQSVERPVMVTPAIAIPEAERTLEAAEGLMENKDYENARKAFTASLGQTESRPLHGRAYYGLARIALTGGKGHQTEAKELFERALANQPPDGQAAWSHYYLGRLTLSLSGDTAKAKQEFEAVLKIEGGSVRVKEEAEKALHEISGDKEKDQ